MALFVLHIRSDPTNINQLDFLVCLELAKMLGQIKFSFYEDTFLTNFSTYTFPSEMLIGFVHSIESS